MEAGQIYLGGFDRLMTQGFADHLDRSSRVFGRRSPGMTKRVRRDVACQAKGFTKKTEVMVETAQN